RRHTHFSRDWSSDVCSSDLATGSRPLPSADQSLRQILQELRSQRQHTSDFSYMRMCSVVLLIVAVFLLLAGLLLGGQSLESFMQIGRASCRGGVWCARRVV